MIKHPYFNDTTSEATHACFLQKGFSGNELFQFQMRGLKQTPNTPNILLANGRDNKRTYFELNTNIDVSLIEQIDNQEYVTFHFDEKYFEYHSSPSNNEPILIHFRYKTFTGACYVNFTTTRICYECNIDIQVRINE